MEKFRSRLELHGAQGRMILAAATDVCVREELNGIYNVTFSYPRLPDDNERYDALIEENEVRFPDGIERGQHFVIKSVDEERKGLRVYKRVEAHHVAFKLGQYFLDEYIDFSANQPPAFLLAKLGNNTPFTFAVEGSFSNQDVFEFGEASKLALLNQTRELYEAERYFDNYTITLTIRAGANHGASIRYRKNLVGVTRKSHSMERVTRLYGYGKNGLTIEGLPGHAVKYIDSVYADPAHLFEGRVDFPEIDDQAALLSAMQRHLKTVELPKVSYEIDFVELEKADSSFSDASIRMVGDTVTVTDELMGYKFDARVTTYERYPFEPKRGRVTLANFREMTEADYIYRATVASRKAMIYTSENAVLKGIKYDDSITLVDGFGMAVSDDFNRVRVRLGQVGPGDYGFTAYNKAGARTIWLDATTGDARFTGEIIAGKITGGTINGAVVNAASLIGGTITAATISAGTITGTDMSASTIRGGSITSTTMNSTDIIGGTLTGAQIQTAAPGVYPRIELSSSNRLLGAYFNASNSIQFRADYANAPAIEFFNFGLLSGRIHTLLGRIEIDGGLTVNDQLMLTGGLSLRNWADVVNRSNGMTLLDSLNSRASVAESGYSLVWDNSTRQIKLFSRTGVQLSSAVIPAS